VGLRTGAAASQDLLLLAQEGLEVVLGDTIEQPLEPAAVVDPEAGGVVEGRRDIDADPLVARAGVERERRMLLALLTSAVGLAARAVLEHERAADYGLVSQDLYGARAGIPLLG
jgi:hypothetical protein